MKAILAAQSPALRCLILLSTLLAAGCGTAPGTPEVQVTGLDRDGTIASYGAQTLRTDPSADSAGRIEGFAPLTVTFNQCRAESILDEDVARYRYDFQGVGVFERGRCRETHVYAAGQYVATACAGDPGDEVCHTRTVVVADRERRTAGADQPVDHVLTILGDSHCDRVIPQSPWLGFSADIEPPIPAGQSYTVTLRIDGPPPVSISWWSQSAAGGGFGSIWDDSTNSVIWGPAQPLPHDHVHHLTPSDRHGRVLLDAGGLNPLTVTVSGFEVPGKRTKIANPLVFTCPGS
jgi:hypothetical protein